MAIHTEIQWCDSTCNCVMGCCGCELRNAAINACYAGNEHDRKGPWITEQTRKGKATGYALTFEDVTRFPGRVEKAAQWPGQQGLRRDDKPWLNGAPRMIFLSDMGDALSPHKSVYVDGQYRPVEPGSDFLYLCAEIINNVSSINGRRHTWLWLSKQMHYAVSFGRWLRDMGVRWPSNLWIGTSITESKYLNRASLLLQVGDESTTRFLSVEPQIEPLALRDSLHGKKIAWVIQGGESGARPNHSSIIGPRPRHVARPFELNWARQLARECADAGVAYFLKQLGSNVINNGKPLPLQDSHGGDWHDWPRDLAVREVPGVDRRWSRP